MTDELSSPPLELSGIAQAMNITIASWNQGEVSVETTVALEHTNKGGVAHGGLFGMMLDMALGGTLVSTLKIEEWCATTSLNVNFIDAAKVGNHLTATGRIVRRGRNVAHLAGEIITENGRVVATATGVWAIWDHKPASMG